MFYRMHEFYMQFISVGQKFLTSNKVHYVTDFNITVVITRPIERTWKLLRNHRKLMRGQPMDVFQRY